MNQSSDFIVAQRFSEEHGTNSFNYLVSNEIQDEWEAVLGVSGEPAFLGDRRIALTASVEKSGAVDREPR